LTGSYKFKIGEKFAIEPAALLKFVNPIPVQADLSIRGIYNGNLWLGTSYRTTDAAVIYAGYDIMNYLSLGYAYDISTSDIRNYSDGSHELLIQLRFGRKQVLEPQN
jgi:type IX secretion system PorP/SprF family membrane protein